MPQFAHILVLKNPKSTNARGSQQYIEAIKRASPESMFEGIPFDNDLPATLAASLTGNTLLCVAGGDGTINSVLQILLGHSSLTESQRQTPILPLWGGNANDLAHILNGRPSREKCQVIMKQGIALPIYPLRCTITADDGNQQVRFASCYISFGATAHIARLLNNPGIREHPLYNLPVGKIFGDAVISLKALADAPTFVIEHAGERKIVYDWIIGKGPRMAKLLHLPVELTDQTFYQSKVERKWLPDVASRVASMAWGNLSPTKDQQPITFTTTEPIWAQFDGEPLQLSAQVSVTVSINEKPFFALCTVPKKQQSATLKA